jgi:hypothetical protein
MGTSRHRPRTGESVRATDDDGRWRWAVGRSETRDDGRGTMNELGTALAYNEDQGSWDAR